MPADETQLRAVPGIAPRSLEQWGKTWLERIAQAPRGEAPLVEDLRPDAAHKALVKQLGRTVRHRAEALGVPPSLLAARAGLERLAREGAGSAIPALQGWRRHQVGEALLAALDSA